MRRAGPSRFYVWTAALLAALFLAPAAPQAAPKDTPAAGSDLQQVPDEAHALASKFLDRINADSMMQTLLAQSRTVAVQTLVQYGQTEDKAGEIFDTFMLPEFRRRLPELRARFEDILAEDFTVPELRAILNNEQNAARRSAAAKAPQLQSQFADAGRIWGRQVGVDVYEANKETFHKLGLDNFGTGPQ